MDDSDSSNNNNNNSKWNFPQLRTETAQNVKIIESMQASPTPTDSSGSAIDSGTSNVNKMTANKGLPGMSLAAIFNPLFDKIAQGISKITLTPLKTLPPVKGMPVIERKCLPKVSKLNNNAENMLITLLYNPKYYIRIFATKLCKTLAIIGGNKKADLSHDIEIIVEQIEQIFIIPFIFFFIINVYLLLFYEDYKEMYTTEKRIKMFLFTKEAGRYSPPIRYIYDALFTSKFGGIFQVGLSFPLAGPYYFNEICFNWIGRLIRGMIGNQMILFGISGILAYFMIYKHLPEIMHATSIYYNGSTNNLSSMLYAFIFVKIFFDIVAVFVSPEMDKASVMAQLPKFTIIYLCIMFFYVLFEILYNIIILPFTSVIFMLNILTLIYVPFFMNPLKIIGKVINQVIIGSRYHGWNPYAKNTVPNGETGIFSYTLASNIYWAFELCILLFFEIAFIVFFCNCISDCSSNMQNLELLSMFIIINLVIILLIINMTLNYSCKIYQDCENENLSPNYIPPMRNPKTNEEPKFPLNSSIMKMFLSKETIRMLYSEKLPQEYIDAFNSKPATDPNGAGGLMGMLTGAAAGKMPPGGLPGMPGT
jgi:hypothetical protein